MNLEETGELLAVLTVMWPNHPAPNPRAMAVGYQMALADVSYDDAMAAAAQHIKTSKFFPTAAELRPAAEPPRMDPRDYQGDAYLDVPWLTGGRRDNVRALPEPAVSGPDRRRA